jgi:branched-chain amino acid transport system permease protein
MRFDYDTSYAEPLKLLRYRGAWLAYGALAAGAGAVSAAGAALLRRRTDLSSSCALPARPDGADRLHRPVSLGTAFVGVGAYAHALLLAHEVPFLVSLAGASLVAGAAGLLIGLPAIRVSGLYLAMVTLAFSFVVEHVFGNWKSLTGGYNGMAVADPTLFGIDLGKLNPLYYFCLLVLVLVLTGLANLRGPAPGAPSSACARQAAAHGLGIFVAGYKLLAFALSATICGLAGGLLAHHLKFVTPEAFGLLLSMELRDGGHRRNGQPARRDLRCGADRFPAGVHLAPRRCWPAHRSQSGLEIFVFGSVLVLFVLFEPKGLYGRWLKLKGLIEYFPLYKGHLSPRQSRARSGRYR